MEQMLNFMKENWRLLLPVVLGFLAVYWLLPRVRRDWLVPGSAAGAAALVCGGWFLVHREFATIEAVLFYAFSGIAILGGGMMLAQHNPVRAALSFALVVLSSCGLFLLLAAPFLMAATIIIYGGAIIITFLFVIMLAQQIGMTSADQRSREPFLASLAGFVLLASLIVVLHRNYDTEQFNRRFGPVEEKLQQVMAAKNIVEFKAIADKAEQETGEKLSLADELVQLMPQHQHQEEILTCFEGQQDLKKAKELAEKLLTEMKHMRLAVGSLSVAGPGVPANAVAPTGSKDGLPAANVAAMGRSLFTEYLVAVEIAGVLLLVATIGAIVIAGRRGDKDTGEVLR